MIKNSKAKPSSELTAVGVGEDPRVTETDLNQSSSSFEVPLGIEGVAEDPKLCISSSGYLDHVCHNSLTDKVNSLASPSIF